MSTKKFNILFLGFSLYFFTSPLWALVTYQTTLGGSYFKDLNENQYAKVMLDWEFNHVLPSGVETYIEMGIDNNLSSGEWKIFPYQFYLTAPFGYGFEERPFHKSRVQVGRQLITEGFQTELIDGITLPYYFSPSLKLNSFAGLVKIVEDLYQIDKDSKEQLYGTSLSFEKWLTTWQAGINHHRVDDDNNNLVFSQITTNWEMLPFSPLTLLKGEWGNIGSDKEWEFSQSISSLYLTLHKSLQLHLDYSVRKPELNLNSSKSFLYKLFALTPTKTWQVGSSWQPISTMVMKTNYQQIAFDSTAGEEAGVQSSTSISYLGSPHRIDTTLTYLASYGGDVWNMNGQYLYRINRSWDLKLQGDLAKIKKLNSISGWASQMQSGLQLKLEPNWLALASIEMERNHQVNFDVRAVFYVSHFYY